MPKRTSFLSALTVLSMLTAAHPVFGQALVPHMVQLDTNKLEQQGIGLVQEATQLAQFQQFDLALSRARMRLIRALTRSNAHRLSILVTLLFCLR